MNTSVLKLESEMNIGGKLMTKRDNLKVSKKVDEAYKIFFNCVQVPIFDLSKIYKQGIDAYLDGGQDNLNKAFFDLAEKYKNLSKLIKST